MFSARLEESLAERRMLHIVPDTSQGMAMLIHPDGELAGFFTVAFCKEWVKDNPEWSYDALPTNRAR
jgi:hypothetical protein